MVFGSIFEAYFEGAVAEKIQNELTELIFVDEAKAQRVLKIRADCKSEKMNEFAANIKIDNDYFDLYNVLDNNNIIKKELSWGTFFTGSRKHTVNPEVNIEPRSLEKIIQANMPASLKCYNIDYNTLSNILKSHLPTKKGGKRRKNKQNNKTKKRTK